MSINSKDYLKHLDKLDKRLSRIGLKQEEIQKAKYQGRDRGNTWKEKEIRPLLFAAANIISKQSHLSKLMARQIKAFKKKFPNFKPETEAQEEVVQTEEGTVM